MTTGFPPAEHPIDAALVRALLAEQHPNLADQPISLLASGWDNETYRLGDTMAVRMPRRTIAATLLANEQKWLPQLAPHLPLPISAPLRIGKPNAQFPWPWSVVPFLSGETIDLAPLHASEADTLAAFLRALHKPAPSDAPPNPVRGGPLSGRLESVDDRFNNLAKRGEPVSPALLHAWEDALATEVDVTGVWLHGDMHPRNLLSRNGRIAAVIDWGDMTSGDPATDLASTWMLLDDRAARERALDLYAPTAKTLTRARGWAVLFAVMTRDAGLTNNPAFALIGAATMQRIADGP